MPVLAFYSLFIPLTLKAILLGSGFCHTNNASMNIHRFCVDICSNKLSKYQGASVLD